MDIRGLAKFTGLDFTKKNTKVDIRTSSDGSLITLPWFQSLVFGGYVGYINAGSVTTGVAGHAAVDADQPEIALRVLDGTEVLPLFLSAVTESFETTLGIHELMYAVSNIDVGNGTSTAFNTTGVPINYRMDLGSTSACLGRHTYSGNGTDPLTAGNFFEMGRESGNFDSDAATSGIKGLSLQISAANKIMPVIRDAGSIVGYGGGGTTANYYFHVIFAENPEDWLSK